MFADSESTQDMKYTKTDPSLVNFACPDRHVLKEQKKMHAITCERPGIMHCNIDAVVNISDTKKSYTICLDGKKIMSGFSKKLGEVDLFGNESSLSL